MAALRAVIQQERGSCDERIPLRILRYFVRQLELADGVEQYVQLYDWASATLGASTRNDVVASDPAVCLRVGRLFAGAEASQSVCFYYSWLDGKPLLLKVLSRRAAAMHEAAVYAATPAQHQTHRHLIHVELVPWKCGHAQFMLPADVVLSMPRVALTAAHLPDDVSGSHVRLVTAAEHVAGALSALQAGGYAHCDVKPDNIFIDAGGHCFLED